MKRLTSTRGICFFLFKSLVLNSSALVCAERLPAHTSRTPSAHSADNQSSRTDDQCRQALPSPRRTEPRGWLTEFRNRCRVSVCVPNCELKSETKFISTEHFPSDPCVGTVLARGMSLLCVFVCALLSIETPRVRHDCDTLCLTVSPRHESRVVRLTLGADKETVTPRRMVCVCIQSSTELSPRISSKEQQQQGCCC